MAPAAATAETASGTGTPNSAGTVRYSLHALPVATTRIAAIARIPVVGRWWI